jgi:hypothetical protein
MVRPVALVVAGPPSPLPEDAFNLRGVRIGGAERIRTVDLWTEP